MTAAMVLAFDPLEFVDDVFMLPSPESRAASGTVAIPTVNIGHINPQAAPTTLHSSTYTA
jgi:hypothetical protein